MITPNDISLLQSRGWRKLWIAKGRRTNLLENSLVTSSTIWPTAHLKLAILKVWPCCWCLSMANQWLIHNYASSNWTILHFITSGALHWAEELYAVNPVQERVEGYLRYFKSQIQSQLHTRGRRGDSGEENIATWVNRYLSLRSDPGVGLRGRSWFGLGNVPGRMKLRH